MPDGIAQITAGRQRANVANRRRYRQLMRYMGTLRKQVITGGYGAASKLLGRMGAIGRARIGETFAKERAGAEQDLISRGLGGTTIRTGVRRGIASDEEQALQELSERMYGQRAGLLERRAGAEMQLGGMRAGIMERRTDAGPDVGMYAGLMKAAGAAGGAGGRAMLSIPPPSNWQAGGGPMTRWQGQQAAGAAGGGGGGGLAPAGGGGGATGRAGPAQVFRGGATGGGTAIAGSPGAGIIQGAGAGTTDLIGGGGVGFYGAGEQPGFISGEGGAAPGALPAEAMQPQGQTDILGMAREMAGPEAAGKIGSLAAGGAATTGKYSYEKWRIFRMHQGKSRTKEAYAAYLKE